MTLLPSIQVAALFSRVKLKIHILDNELQHVDPHNPSEIAASAHAIVTAAKDLRAVATAVSHSLQRPRPDLVALASAQQVSPSGLRRRYNSAVVPPLAKLMQGDSPDAKMLIDNLESLVPGDLLGMNPLLDKAIEDAFGRNSLTETGSRALEARIQGDVPRLSELLADPDWVLDEDSPPASNVAKQHALELLGEVIINLTNASPSTAFRGQLGAGGSGANISWKADISMDQALSALVPLRYKGNAVGGLRGLSIVNSDATVAYLSRTNGTTPVQLRLIRE